MNAGAIAHIAAHEDASPAHGVARCIAGRARDGDLPGVHGVAGRVLRVAAGLDLRAVQISAQRIARHALDDDVPPGRARADIALSADVFQHDVPISRVFDLLIDLTEAEIFHIQARHAFAPPSFCARAAEPKAISCGFSRIKSKSRVFSGVCSRTSEV